MEGIRPHTATRPGGGAREVVRVEVRFPAGPASYDRLLLGFPSETIVAPQTIGHRPNNSRVWAGGALQFRSSHARHPASFAAGARTHVPGPADDLPVAVTTAGE